MNRLIETERVQRGSRGTRALPNASTAEIVSGGRPRGWKTGATRALAPFGKVWSGWCATRDRLAADKIIVLQAARCERARVGRYNRYPIGLSPLPSADTLVFWPRSTGRCQGEAKPRSIRDTIYARRPRAPPSFSHRSTEVAAFLSAALDRAILTKPSNRSVRCYFFLSVDAYLSEKWGRKIAG